MPAPLYEQLKHMRKIFLSSTDKEEKTNEITLFKQMIAWSDSLGILEPEEWETAKQTMQDYGTKTINAVYSVFGKEEGKRALLDEDHLEGYCLFPAKSDKELGMYLATIHGVWDRIHKTLHDYFDVEQYGRDFRERSAGTYFWDGFIFHDSNFNEDNPWEA